MKATRLFRDFFNSEKAGGLVLIFCTLISLILANSITGEAYQHFWHMQIFNHSLSHWINDGLMTVFFLLIGLELEREIYIGELSDFRDALLPIVAAVGGMLMPAGIFLALNFGTPAHLGAGIPMATDIAFALGILSLLGSRVPSSLKVFLTALAVIDDLGAILVIAIFYTKTIFWGNLLAALAIFLVLLFLNKKGVRLLLPYMIGGVAMWFFMLNSGVHATITGVLLAFTIPFDDGNEKAISFRLQNFLHKPIAFFVLPLFALANTAFTVDAESLAGLREHYSIGVAAGLLLGKPLGIFLACLIAVSLKLCSLPNDLNWKMIGGAGILGGIGFTMSIFITMLAYHDTELINNTKLTVLLSSLVAGLGGLAMLSLTLDKTVHEE